MSGTSLDGVDLACCTFSFKKQWKFEIEKAETIRYSPTWFKKLRDAHMLSAAHLLELDHAYGKFLGLLCKEFISKNGGNIQVNSKKGIGSEFSFTIPSNQI